MIRHDLIGDPRRLNAFGRDSRLIVVNWRSSEETHRNCLMATNDLIGASSVRDRPDQLKERGAGNSLVQAIAITAFVCSMYELVKVLVHFIFSSGSPRHGKSGVTHVSYSNLLGYCTIRRYLRFTLACHLRYPYLRSPILVVPLGRIARQPQYWGLQQLQDLDLPSRTPVT